jgi:hypothetical protein
MGMLAVNNGCGCPSLAGLGFDSTATATDSSVSWADYEALLTAYQQQGLTQSQAQAAAASKLTSSAATAGQLIPGVPNTYLIIGAAALLVLVSMQR